MCQLSAIKRAGAITGFQLKYNGGSLFLSSRKYSELDAQDARAILAEIIRVRQIGGGLAPAWIDRINARPDFRSRLINAGLFDAPRVLTIAELFGAYIKSKGLKPATVTAKRVSLSRLDQIAGAYTVDRWNELTAGKIFEILSANYAPATVSATIKDARAVFAFAVRAGLVSSNPFAHVKTAGYTNRERLEYIPLDTFNKLLSVCDSTIYRALLILARVGGLRAPSEVFAVRWADVDFINGKIRVESSKTARYTGHSFRIVPMFPAVRAILAELKSETVETTGDQLVLESIPGRSSVQLGRVIDKLCKLANVEAWGRPMQNLRASASTDIYNNFGAIAEKVWVGHSEKISVNHYQTITPEIFARAIAPEEAPAPLAESIPPAVCAFPNKIACAPID